MDEEQQADIPEQGNDWLIKGGCGLIGAVGCIVLLVILIAVTIMGGTLLLFTAPPMEYVSQVTSFLENYSVLMAIVLLLLTLLIGGGGGYLIGSFIARQRRNAASKSEST